MHVDHQVMTTPSMRRKMIEESNHDPEIMRRAERAAFFLPTINIATIAIENSINSMY